MSKKLLHILIVAILALLVLIGWQIIRSLPNDTQTLSLQPMATSSVSNTNVVRTPFTFATVSGKEYSAEPLIVNKVTKIVTTDFYQNTLDTNTYDIFYDDGGGTTMILLYDEDLKSARASAEKQLLSILPYTKTELCDLQITVQTNQYVNAKYSGVNLGLSFCPNSVTIN